jgi:hypothetical protein
MRVGLDFDGTIVNHSGHKLKLAAARGYELLDWQANTNVMKHHMPADDYKEIKEMIYTAMTVEAPPMDGFAEALQKLDGELYLISARRPDSVRFAQDWMQAHRVYDRIPAERVHFCSSSKDKHKVVHELQIDVYLDDKISVLESLPYRTKKCLFDSACLRDKMELRHDIEPIKSWQHFAEVVTAMKAAA